MVLNKLLKSTWSKRTHYLAPSPFMAELRKSVALDRVGQKNFVKELLMRKMRV